MTTGRRWRIAIGAAVAIGVAYVIARRSQLWGEAESWVEEPYYAPPVVPPYMPPPVPVERPVAAAAVPPQPPPPARPAAPPPPPPRRRRPRGLALAAGLLLLVAGGLAGASYALRSNTLGDSFKGTIPTTTTAPSTTTTAGTTTPATTTSAATTAATTTAGTTTTSHPGGNAAGAAFCVNTPRGWKAESNPSLTRSKPSALVLTNFRFGAAADEWGLSDRKLRWASGDTLIVVADWTKAASADFRRGFQPGTLHIRSSDIGSYPGFPVAIGHRLVSLNGRLLELWVEARPPSASAFAEANRVLAGVRTCSP